MTSITDSAGVQIGKPGLFLIKNGQYKYIRVPANLTEKITAIQADAWRPDEAIVAMGNTLWVISNLQAFQPPLANNASQLLNF